MISSVAPPLPASLSANNLAGKSVSSPPRTARFRRIVAFSTATASEARSTWTDQPRSSSYLSPQGMASCTSLYEVLGIQSAASNQEIKAAYRRLARVCHPDVAAMDQKHSSANEFMKIHAAYSTLSDPQKRADYDRRLFTRPQRPLTTVSRFSGYTSRNWETDQCW
ncbi:hypothetical protein L6164_027627 [Bauhinia variegata]|uniref:Uncharacterized protein n=1 Tax=Bauhinia variegata TaxID=167791 RepID=A0ACB9LV40_BAUVA|nr:hypothetical protein L6164_027627 [Bauhinia variegata]